jgi:hypothetical protein
MTALDVTMLILCLGVPVFAGIVLIVWHGDMWASREKR